jgi:transposase
LSHHQIKVMYADGVEAVTQAIRQLYEMIETDDERIQRLVASATAAHLQRIEQLSGRINRLEDELASRVRQVHQLDLTVKDLNKQLREAREQTRLAREAHLATVLKNSQNSSLPPSTDRGKRTSSLPEKSGRKPGGQVGHRGATREMADVPDHRIIHTPESCSLCGSSLLDSEVGQRERRQVHDLPPPKLEVVEHQAQTKVCQRCGTKNKAKFPAGVNAPVQYGEGIRAVATYLMGYQLLPFERCAEAMGDLFNCQL